MPTPTIHILATVRTEELLPAALFVFRTIRVGFPTAKIKVFGNSLPDYAISPIVSATDGCDAEYINLVDGRVDHHVWLARAIKHSCEPMVVMDTDLAFWDNFEQFDFSGCALAGRYTPEFFCKFANAETRPRLHTSLLYVDPIKIRGWVDRYVGQFPQIYCCPRPTIEGLVFPRYNPMRHGKMFSSVRNYFSDTCSLLYEAIGGQSFTEEQNAVYDHLHMGTLSDAIAPAYPNDMIRETHFSIFENPDLLRGAYKKQCEWYEKNKA